MMTDEKLDKLFELVKNEGTNLSATDVLEWVETTEKSMSKRKKTRFTILIFVSIVLLSMLLLLFKKNAPTSTQENKEHSTPHPSQLIENVTSLTMEPQKADINQKNVLFENQLKAIVSDSAHTLLTTIELPNRDSAIIQPTIELPTSETELAEKIVANPIVQPLVSEKQEVIRNVIIILDTISAYRSAAKYKMDQNDCYLQIYNDYVVISYQSRGRFFYASGTIHREELQEINEHKYNVFAFQRDNQATGTSLGKRVFFGYREVGNGGQRVEVVFFNQPWAVSTVIKSHYASPKEIKWLMERSKEQSNGKE
jgi:hypothetical protein